jgi:hypothetical protein
MSKTNDLEKIISRTSFENIRSNNIVKSLTPEVEASRMNWFSIIKYGLIILILAMLGFNLFTYLGMFTDATASVVAPLTKIFGKSSGDILKQTAVVSGEGSKGLIDVVSGSIVGGVDVLQQNVTDNNVRSRITRHTTVILIISFLLPMTLEARRKHRRANQVFATLVRIVDSEAV